MGNKFQNLKIAITDNDHLKAVCDVLESMGYQQSDYMSKYPNYICSYRDGYYHSLSDVHFGCFDSCTLTDLLKMRDEMVKHNAKSSQE